MREKLAREAAELKAALDTDTYEDGYGAVDLRLDLERALAGFLHHVPVPAAPLVDLLRGGPSEPVWHPVQNPGSTISWSHSQTL